jgi:hypothetical protein
MLRWLIGEPLHLTDRQRYRLLGWVVALVALDVAVPAAHETLGLPEAITMTLQVIALFGSLLAFV